MDLKIFFALCQRARVTTRDRKAMAPPVCDVSNELSVTQLVWFFMITY
jgi:hypothetical protein